MQMSYKHKSEIMKLQQKQHKKMNTALNQEN